MKFLFCHDPSLLSLVHSIDRKDDHENRRDNDDNKECMVLIEISIVFIRFCGNGNKKFSENAFRGKVKANKNSKGTKMMIKKIRSKLNLAYPSIDSGET